MRIIEKWMKRITDILAVMACVMILGMMLLAVLDVVLRIFFKSPIIGATEIIQILNVGIVVALGAGTVRNQHVTVDFVMDKVPGVPRYYIQLAVDVLNIAVLALMSYCSFQLMRKSMEQGYTYSLLKIPEWPFVGLIAVGLIGGILGVVYIICRRIREHGESARDGGPERPDQEHTGEG